MVCGSPSPLLPALSQKNDLKMSIILLSSIIKDLFKIMLVLYYPEETTQSEGSYYGFGPVSANFAPQPVLVEAKDGFHR